MFIPHTAVLPPAGRMYEGVVEKRAL